MERSLSLSLVGSTASIVVILVAALSATASAAETGSGPTEKDRNATTSDRTPPSVTEADLERWFHATDAELLPDGRVKLRYNFETMEEALLADFSPDIRKTKGRVRWSRSGEGGSRFLEHGLIIANLGFLLHKARWEDAVVKVDFMSLTGHRNGNILAAVYAYGKNQKHMLASNQGRQCLKLTSRMKLTRPPIPRRDPAALSADRRFEFGYRIRDGVFAAETGEVRSADTSNDPKFTKNLEPGHAGLAWKGQIQGYVFMIDIEGKLDPKWIEEQLSHKARK